jgi:hypothetical protein
MVMTQWNDIVEVIGAIFGGWSSDQAEAVSWMPSVLSGIAVAGL